MGQKFTTYAPVANTWYRKFYQCWISIYRKKIP